MPIRLMRCIRYSVHSSVCLSDRPSVRHLFGFPDSNSKTLLPIDFEFERMIGLLYVLVSSTHKTTHRDMTVLKASFTLAICEGSVTYVQKQLGNLPT